MNKRWWPLVACGWLAGCVVSVGDKGPHVDLDSGTDGSDDGRDPKGETTTPEGTASCATTIPNNVDVVSSLWGSVADNERIWLCAGAELATTGSNGTYFVESGAVLNLSGGDATVYVLDGGEVTVSGNDNTIVYEPGAEVDSNPSATLIECDPLSIDRSNAPSNGC